MYFDAPGCAVHAQGDMDPGVQVFPYRRYACKHPFNVILLQDLHLQSANRGAALTDFTASQSMQGGPPLQSEFALPETLAICNFLSMHRADAYSKKSFETPTTKKAQRGPHRRPAACWRRGSARGRCRAGQTAPSLPRPACSSAQTRRRPSPSPRPWTFIFDIQARLKGFVLYTEHHLEHISLSMQRFAALFMVYHGWVFAVCGTIG